MLIRLKSIDKELLYKIFCLDNQAFVAMVIKMSKHHVNTHHNQFSYNSKESVVNVYKPEQILLPLSTFLFSFKRESLTFNYYYDSKNDKIKAEKVS